MSVSVCCDNTFLLATVMVAMLTLNACTPPPNEAIDVMDAEFQSVEDYSEYDVESKTLSRDQPL